MEGVTVLSTELINNTATGYALIVLSVLVFLILVCVTIYYGVVDAGDIAILIGGTLACLISFFVGVAALKAIIYSKKSQ